MKLFGTAAFFAAAAVFAASCRGPEGASGKRLDFSIKNSSPGIVTVLYQGDEKSFRMIAGMCRKLAALDFPLSVVFHSSFKSPLALNEPGHYIIEGPGRAREASGLCRPMEIE